MYQILQFNSNYESIKNFDLGEGTVCRNFFFVCFTKMTLNFKFLQTHVSKEKKISVQGLLGRSCRLRYHMLHPLGLIWCITLTSKSKFCDWHVDGRSKNFYPQSFFCCWQHVAVHVAQFCRRIRKNWKRHQMFKQN